jgi:hypothetical protein
MFDKFEYYLLASWVYPLISITTHIVKNKTRIMNEIFSVKGFDSYEELYMNSVRQRAPTYVSAPNVFIPIGGGTYNEWNKVYSASRGSPNGLYWNYTFHKLSKSIINKEYIFINSPENLEKYIPKEEHSRFPIAYPMKLEKYNLKSRLLYFHQSTGYVEARKDYLLAQALFKTRPAGTLVIPSMALLCFLASWGMYKHNKSAYPISYRDEPSPTNIINTMKKILTNSKDA